MVREKLKILFNSMEWVGFSTSQPWRAYNVKFNKYFNYPEKDIRAEEFPGIYGSIGYALKELDNEIRFEARFSSIDPAIFEEMRLSGEWESKFYEDAFMEVGLGREYM